MEDQLDLATVLPLATSNEQLHSYFVAHTVVGTDYASNFTFKTYYNSRGRVFGHISLGNDFDYGDWRIDDDNRLCVRWSRWIDGHELCTSYYQINQQVVALDAEGRVRRSYDFTPGDPHGLVDRMIDLK